MRARSVLLMLVGVVALGIVGCGGDGSSGPPPQGTTGIQGQVNVSGDATGYRLLLDGQPVPGALRADGTYRIEGVPAGTHRIAVMDGDGMTGGYTTVVAREGEMVRAPEIVPGLGGQIVGMVTVREEGGLRALAGVEVTAQPATVMIMNEDGTAPDIYPPPEPPEDLPTFSAFTNDAGSFLIGAVPEGEYVVTVVVPDMEGTWQWVWVSAGHTAVADFELRPAIEPGVGTVQGRVEGIHDGERAPLEGARVTIYCEDWWEPVGPIEINAGSAQDEGGGSAGPMPPDPGMIAPPYFDALSTLTDADGHYTLNAPAGYASIEVWMPEYEPAWQEIVIRAREILTVNFGLTPWSGEEPPVTRPDNGQTAPPNSG